jgi:hypothetical protein
LIKELNAKAFAMTSHIAKNGIKVEKGEGYYATISRANSEQINQILRTKIHPKKFKELNNNMFIPEKISVDHKDTEDECSEIIHGILRHEIGEVKYNDWKQFILRQYIIEQKAALGEMGKGWGKDYGAFINAVGDPRINYLVSRDSAEAKKDIMYSELAGLLCVLDIIATLPNHHQFMMLANCRDAEAYAPKLVNLIKQQADPVIVKYYEKHKKLLEQIARTKNILKFYELANQLWVDYSKNIVDLKKRDLDDYPLLFKTLPMSSSNGIVYDKYNGVLIPLPMDAMKDAGTLPNTTIVNRLDNREDKAGNKYLDRKRLKEIQEKIKELDEKKSKADNRGIQSGDQEKGSGKGTRTKIGVTNLHYQKRFKGYIEDLCNRFANNIYEFMPKQASDIVKRQSRGRLSIRSYVNTQGKARNIYNKLDSFMKYYAVFSIIVDTSGSMSERVNFKRRKISYVKDAAYALCDGLAQKNIPFELLTYGSYDCFNLEIIHTIDDLSDFNNSSFQFFNTI